MVVPRTTDEQVNIDFRSSYWQVSRQLPVGLVLVAPLWVLYEALAFRLNDGLGGHLRTGIDYVLTTGLARLSLPLEASYLIPGLALLVVFLKGDRRAQVADCKRHYWPLMSVECLIYAAVFGILVSNMSDVFLQGGNTPAQQRWASLVMNLGSGLYEELVFRLAILGTMMLVLDRYISSRWLVLGVSIVVSAVGFSMFHYLDLFGEQFAWPAFIFRLVAGVVFSVVFLVRGYGIAACTHSFYNVFLMFR